MISVVTSWIQLQQDVTGETSEDQRFQRVDESFQRKDEEKLERFTVYVVLHCSKASISEKIFHNCPGHVFQLLVLSQLKCSS